MSERVLENMDRVKALADRLRRVPMLADAVRLRGSGSVEEEAWQIATALADIEESSHKLFTQTVPRLLDQTSKETELSDLLHEVGEEYRHILYHIRDTKLFDYVATDD